jgi:hypothetical protein
VNDELDTLGGCHADFERSAVLVGTDEHDEVVEVEDSDGVAVGVELVVVGDPCLRALARMTGSMPST